jgi:hypothetical protein
MSCSPEVIDFMDACYMSQKNLPESNETKVDMTQGTEMAHKAKLETAFVGVDYKPVPPSSGGWGLYLDQISGKKVGRKKRIAQFAVVYYDHKREKNLIPTGCYMITCWVNNEDKWNELLNLPKYQCLRDEFKKVKGGEKMNIIVQGGDLIGDNHGTLNDLIRECLKPY